jgi:CRP-like cAMP-binding protein
VDIGYSVPSVDTPAERVTKPKSKSHAKGARWLRHRSGDCRRIATALAISEATCLYLDQKQWHNYLSVRPNMRSRLLMACGHRMEHHLANIQYLKG